MHSTDDTDLAAVRQLLEDHALFGELFHLVAGASLGAGIDELGIWLPRSSAKASSGVKVVQSTRTALAGWSVPAPPPAMIAMAACFFIELLVSGRARAPAS